MSNRDPDLPSWRADFYFPKLSDALCKFFLLIGLRHWPIFNMFNIDSSGSIPNSEDDFISCNNLRISESQKGKLTDVNEKFSKLLLYMRL